MHAIERMGEVDEAALLADRRDRVRRTTCRAGSPPRRKSPITSPWSSVFTSSPGMTIRSRPRASSTASSAPPNTLWSVTAMPPSPIASAWSTSSSRRDRAVVRPVGVHVEVDRDPVAVGERVDVARRTPSTALARQSRVDRRRARPRPRRSSVSRRGSLRPAPRASAARCPRASRATSAATSSLVVAAHDRGAARGGLEREAVLAARRGNEDRGRSRERRLVAAASVRRGRGHGRAPIAGSSGGSRAASCAGACASQPGAPPRSRSSARVVARPGDSSSMAISVPLRRRGEHARGRRRAERWRSRPRSGRSPPPRSPREVARSASTRARRRSRRERRAGYAEPVDREERRRRERVRRVEREVREAREARLEPVHDVEAALGQREAEVRSHADRHAHVRPSRERDRRADRDDLRVVAALECSAAGQQVARARRRREDRHRRGRARRSAFAAPSTCAFTSCGCDHANGVTKQMRRLTLRKLQRVPRLAEQAVLGDAQRDARLVADLAAAA